MGPPNAIHRKRISPKHDSANPIATRIRPTDGACFCITRSLGSWTCGLEDGAERSDQLGRRRRVEDVLDVAAARGEVDAAVEAVRVLVLEDRVPEVPEPGCPIEVALVPGRPAAGLRIALPARAPLRPVGVVGGHVAEPVDLL